MFLQTCFETCFCFQGAPGLPGDKGKKGEKGLKGDIGRIIEGYKGAKGIQVNSHQNKLKKCCSVKS